MALPVNENPSLIDSLRVQRRVLGALFLREALTRYGRHNIGFLWLFVRDWPFAIGVWLNVRIFALWVNMVQNYWTHDRRWGSRRYDVATDNAMNIGDWLPVMATFSACWQNNHHRYPHLLRTTHDAAEFDFGYFTVRVMNALGLVKASKTGTHRPNDLALAEVTL